ncbi:dUTP diphosphatase [Lederbergia lenta]|uniref:dUTP diphosphatase n=1 Tax=Lederbergia lenta TaxID=1467 RepID=UPI00203D7907|nr:dUTP diphosphatase [Lederbergia lenta]MCM3111653.1 dUTP diphosphatase [Lederbergia lenta]
MNFNKLFSLQKVLDERIVIDKGLEGMNLLNQKILSLQVELGELANELPEVFKFWANKKNNYENALKEYVDGLHFILSIGLEVGFDIDEWEIEIWKEDDMIQQFIILNQVTYEIYKNRKDYYISDLLSHFIGLGEMLGFTSEQIEQAYISKNEINHVRQENGY